MSEKRLIVCDKCNLRIEGGPMDPRIQHWVRAQTGTGFGAEFVGDYCPICWVVMMNVEVKQSSK